MKKLFQVPTLPAGFDLALLILRVSVALLMLSHGLPKLGLLFSDAPIQFPGIMGMSPGLSLFMAVFAEVLCSLFILFGFGTRLAVVPLIITMLVAVFMIHANDPLAKKEAGLQYLLVYLVLFITASGKYSLDQLFFGKKIKA